MAPPMLTIITKRRHSESHFARLVLYTAISESVAENLFSGSAQLGFLVRFQRKPKSEFPGVISI